MKRNVAKSASILGAAAVAGLLSVGAAHAAPAGKVHLSDGVQKVAWPGDAGNDLHAYPGGPGFWGKGAGVPSPYGYYAAPRGHHHGHGAVRHYR